MTARREISRPGGAANTQNNPAPCELTGARSPMLQHTHSPSEKASRLLHVEARIRLPILRCKRVPRILQAAPRGRSATSVSQHWKSRLALDSLFHKKPA